MTSSPSFQPCIDSQNLAKRLAKLAPGECVSYAELNAIVAPDRRVNGEHRYLLETARDIVLRDNGIVVGCVRAEGMKRLTNDEIAEEPASRLSAVRRHVKKSIKRGSHADPTALSNDERNQYFLSMSALGVMHQFSSPNRLRRIGDAVKTAQKRLDFSGTLALFAK